MSNRNLFYLRERQTETENYIINNVANLFGAISIVTVAGLAPVSGVVEQSIVYDNTDVITSNYEMECDDMKYFSNNICVNLNEIDNIKKIKKMSKLEKGWNGYNGEAFSDFAINRFINIVSGLTIQPDIAPTGRGSLLLKYKNEEGSVLAFEINENHIEKAFVPKGKYNDAYSETYYSNYCDEINNSVGEFYGINKNR